MNEDDAKEKAFLENVQRFAAAMQRGPHRTAKDWKRYEQQERFEKRKRRTSSSGAKKRAQPKGSVPKSASAGRLNEHNDPEGRKGYPKSSDNPLPSSRS